MKSDKIIALLTSAVLSAAAVCSSAANAINVPAVSLSADYTDNLKKSEELTPYYAVRILDVYAMLSTMESGEYEFEKANADCDYNGDGFINGNDASLFISSYCETHPFCQIVCPYHPDEHLKNGWLEPYDHYCMVNVMIRSCYREKYTNEYGEFVLPKEFEVLTTAAEEEPAPETQTTTFKASTIICITTAAEEEPEPETTTTAVDENIPDSKIFKDINGDGKINLYDALSIYKLASYIGVGGNVYGEDVDEKLRNTAENGDLNQDGEVNMADTFAFLYEYCRTQPYEQIPLDEDSEDYPYIDTINYYAEMIFAECGKDEMTVVDETVYGDANGDGNVTISDAVAILQYLANSEEYPLSEQGKLNADVDGQAGVTGKDAAAIQLYDAKAVTELPIK